MQTRRVFLKAFGTLLLVSTTPLLTQCAGERRGEKLELPDAGSLGIDADVLEILALASLAPSGHNTQPWMLEIKGSREFELSLDPTRRLPAVDPDDREAMLSLGAFLETAFQAARARGVVASFEPLETAIATMRFADATDSREPAVEGAIRERRTLRKGHSAEAVTAEDVAPMLDGIERARFVGRASAEGQSIAKLTMKANEIQAARKPAVEELSEWIRWDDDEARKKRDGLTPEGMEIQGFAGWYVRHTYSKDDVLTEGFREETLDLVREQLESPGGWVVISSGRAPDREGLLDAGRRLQRVWLRARSLGIAVHPMSQALEEKETSDTLQTSLASDDGHVQMLFRIGHASDMPEPVSLRRRVDAFVRS